MQDVRRSLKFFCHICSPKDMPVSQRGPMSPAIVKVISVLWGDKIVGLSFLAKSTRNQSHGLGHKDLALGIKGERGGDGYFSQWVTRCLGIS